LSRELVIYADESEKNGKHFGNFYGALIVRSTDLLSVTQTLHHRKTELGLTGEMKWTHTNASVSERYAQMMGTLFQLVNADRVKIRVMFTQKRYVPINLTSQQREDEFQILYYQFIKHGLGLAYANTTDELLRVRLYLDQLPDTKEKNARFKAYIAALNKYPPFRESQIHFAEDQIAEVRSHDHILLQCLDVVLGAIHFRLNDKHKKMSPGKRRRGTRTIVKELLYREISRQIRSLRANFNIGITTGDDGERENRWKHPYRHWLFVPTDSKIDENQGKKKAP